MKPQLLFVTGFQKSGTSLVNRVLMAQPFIDNPFLPEGKFFWGDHPVTEPSASPCGELYQRHQGRHGHQLVAADYDPAHQNLLQQRITEAAIDAPVLMNKNPNLVVRLTWLKRVLPTAQVVLVLRDPVANIYSFSKKYHQEKAADPDFWWGVKPSGWQALVQADSLQQIIAQWQAVMRHVLQHQTSIDQVIRYDRFCQDPEQHLAQLTRSVGQDPAQIVLPFESLTCMDEEYKTGGSQASKNILLRREQTFDIPAADQGRQDYPPFTAAQIQHIEQQTNELWQQVLAATADRLLPG